jgi:hypothetical protein
MTRIILIDIVTVAPHRSSVILVTHKLNIEMQLTLPPSRVSRHRQLAQPI